MGFLGNSEGYTRPSCGGDLDGWPTYSQLMAESGAFLILTIETKDPIEIGAFVGEFTSLANQYQRYMRQQFPNAEGEAEVFVTQVAQGSIVAHLLPYWPAVAGAGGIGLTALTVMERLNTLEDFVERWFPRLGRYFNKDGREPEATKGDLRDFHNTVEAIARDPEAVLKLEAAHYEDGHKNIKATFKFTTQQARVAEQEIENHKKEIEASSSADHERVLMTFVRPDIRTQKAGKPSGELVLIESLSDKPRPLIYASNLAEERIKYEIRDQESVFKKIFVVDVNVEMRRGKPFAYRIKNVHQVIDEPEEP
jgi:hypothetical protein